MVGLVWAKVPVLTVNHVSRSSIVLLGAGHRVCMADLVPYLFQGAAILDSFLGRDGQGPGGNGSVIHLYLNTENYSAYLLLPGRVPTARGIFLASPPISLMPHRILDWPLIMVGIRTDKNVMYPITCVPYCKVNMVNIW